MHVRVCLRVWVSQVSAAVVAGPSAAECRMVSLYSDGEFFISIANVGSKLAICLQHLIDGNASCCRCCIVFGKWI